MSREYRGFDFKISRFTRLLTSEDSMSKKGSEKAAEVALEDEGSRGLEQAAAAEVATVGKGSGGGGKATPAGARNPSQASRDLMKNFLSKTPISKRGREDWAASPRPEQAAKRTTQRGDDEDGGEDCVQLEDMEDGDNGAADEPWQAKLRQTMMEAAGLTPEQANICMQHIKKTFKDRVAEEAKRVAKKVFRDEVEAAKCRRSILMHNADKWVASDQTTLGYNLAERVTCMVHRICGGMINVVDCFTVGAWQEGRMPSSVYLSFGSAQQKSTFFRIMANRIRFGNEAAQSIRVLACRDAFPKEYIPEAKRLAQRGMSLRMNGEVASFRVVARGLGCIPVLETRDRATGGQTARWAVYKEKEAEATDEATPARGRSATGEGEWQVVGGRKKTVRNEGKERNESQERARVRGTPSKVAGGTGRLSVPQPGTIPPTQREEEMEADEIVRFPEGTDMERYEEPY
jgi:hypothetical protein